MEVFKTITVQHRYFVHSCLVLSMVSITAWVTISVLFKRTHRKQSNNKQQCSNNKIEPTPLIAITGCDTGLGYSIVMRYLNGEHCVENHSDNQVFNFSLTNKRKLKLPSKIAIIAFCLDLNGPGAKHLLQQSLVKQHTKLFLRQLDLTDPDSIKQSVTYINDLVKGNLEDDTHDNTNSHNYKLHALINNAARMVMAEYEWQTTHMIQQQFEVNIMGPIMLTAQLLPLFRMDKSRVINIISHCAYLPLPGIALYGATKAAVRAWTISSRIELEDHGVKMITFSPGSFYFHSSIMCGKQRMIDYEQIRKCMTNEQLIYYGSHIDVYQNYLSSIDTYINHPEITIPSSNQVYRLMDHALWAAQPKVEYNVTEPWRYRIYYALSWTLSAFGLHIVRDKVVRQFVATPRYKNNFDNQNGTNEHGC